MEGKMGGLLSHVLVDMAGRKGRVEVSGSTLVYTGLMEAGEAAGPRYRHDRAIKAFECLVTEPGRLYVVLVDEEDILSGVSLGKDSFTRLFVPYRASGSVGSLSLALGLKNDINLFFASRSYKGGKLFHFRLEQGTLQQVAVLEEGNPEDYTDLKSSSDHWGSFNLFYMGLEKGVSVLRHRFFVPFSRTWSPPVTLYGPDQGEVTDFTFLIDADNNIYVTLLLQGPRKKEVIHLKREMGGWPRGGWQRPILISQEDREGIPVIDLFRKGYLQIFFFAGAHSRLFVWRDGEVRSLQKKGLDASGKTLARFRSSSAMKAQYTLLPQEGEPGAQAPAAIEETEEPVPPPADEGPEEEEQSREAGDGKPAGDAEEESAGEEEPAGRLDERDRFVRQAIQIMQAKTDLEASLRKKDRELQKQRSLYEGRLKLLQDQLNSRGEAFRSLETKLSRQEAAVLGLRAEQKSFEKEIGQLKKENWQLREDLKAQERENRDLSLKADQFKRQAEELEKQAEADRSFMGALGRIFRK